MMVSRRSISSRITALLRWPALGLAERCHIWVLILIVPSGLRSSCAIPAANCPSAESRSLWRT